MGIMNMQRRAQQHADPIENATWGRFIVQAVTAAALIAATIVGWLHARQSVLYTSVAGVIATCIAVAQYRRLSERRQMRTTGRTRSARSKRSKRPQGRGR